MSVIWLAGACLLGAAGACGGDDSCDLDAPDTICTVAGSGEAGYAGDGGPAAQAALRLPLDAAISPGGELWILDFGNASVRVLGADGRLRTTVGTGELGDGGVPDGVERVPAAGVAMHFPAALAFHDGYLYLPLWLRGRIVRVRLSDMTLERFAGRGARGRFDGDGGPALDAALDTPVAIAPDLGGGVLVMDQGNEVIRRVDAGGVIRTIAGRCVIDLVTPCAAGTEPVACPGSHKLACGDPAVECEYACAPDFGGDGGPATAARLGQGLGSPPEPSGHMAYDAAGNLLFADTRNHRIRRIDPTGIITTIAGTGAYGYAGDGGPATEAQLDFPTDLDVAADGTVYFTDVRNGCVRAIDPAGMIARVAGQCSPDGTTRGFAGDGGSPLAALLDRPYGLVLDGDRLYIADTGNHRVRVVRLPR